MLCPRPLREVFDRDRAKFCHEVEHGIRILIHDDWPSFLYPETGYNPRVMDHGLLRGPFLVSVSISVICMCRLIRFLQCYRHIFTGVRTALKATAGKAPGKKCLADIYNVSQVTPETIAYVAVLVSSPGPFISFYL
jgi:hypothetical protein